MKIGIIGAGAIANYLLKKINEEKLYDFTVTGILVSDSEKYADLATAYGVTLYDNLAEFMTAELDIVVEAANVEATKTLIPPILREKDVVIISVGALADEVFLKKVYQIAKRHQRTIYLPSGAIGGLDLLQNAYTMYTVESVELITTKPAHTLTNEQLEKEKIVFSGNADEAIERFPRNVNVSVVLSLAGLGVKNTQVTLIADPQETKNIHEIKIAGDFGKAVFKITNNPLPDNPKTSYLAAMSIIGTLNQINRVIKIG